MLPDPVHVNQIDTGGPRGRYLCTAAAGAMALDAFTSGRIRTTAKAIDDLQDDHDTNGLGLDDLATAWQRGWGLTFSHSRVLWPSLKARLDRGDGAVLQGSYRAVPTLYRVQKDFTGGHAVYVARPTRPGFYAVHDPIARAGTVWPEYVVRNFYLSGLGLAGWGAGATAPGAATGQTVATGRTISLATYAGVDAGRTDIFDISRELVIFDTGQANRPAYGGKFAREQIALGYAGEVLIDRANVFLRFVASADGLAPFNNVGEVLLPVDSAGRLDIEAMRATANAFDPFGAGAIANALGGIPKALGDVATNGVYLVAILVLVIVGLYILVRS